MMRHPDLLLLQIDALSLLNAARSILRLGARQLITIALPVAILSFYAIQLVRSNLHLAGALAPHHRSGLLALLCSFTAAAGAAAGLAATRRRRRMIEAPWLNILPLAPAIVSRAIRTAVIADCALAFLLLATILRIAFAPILPGSLLCLTLLAFLPACSAASFLTRPSPAASPTAKARPNHPLETLLHPLDQRRPSLVGLWALRPRLGLLLIAWCVSLIAALGAASASARAHAAAPVSTGLAILIPLILMLLAVNPFPLLSPILRTAPLRFHAVSLALLRLPSSIALAWFLPFSAISLALGWITPGQSAFALLATTILSAMYAMTAFSLPSSPRFALAFFALALLLVADQYASLQNFGFVIMFVVILALLLRSRTIYRRGD